MVRVFSKLIAPYASRIRLMIGRGIVRLVDDSGALQTMQLSVMGDPRDALERIQQYGFTGNPPAGAEAVHASVAGSRDHTVIIAVDHRKFRLKGLAGGEVAIYDDLGQKVHLTRTGIDAVSPTKIRAIAPDIELVATTKVLMTTPLLQVSGDIVAGGDVSDQGGAKSMAGMRQVFNTHTHPENGQGGGTTSDPNQEM